MPTLEPTFLKMDPIGALRWEYLTPIIVFLFFDMFDTVGTLIGVGTQAGFMKDGKLPRVNRALLSDSVGTMVGAVVGTSTTTSYIESAAGVSAGARTGLANLVTAALFLIALFFSPLAEMFGYATDLRSLTQGRANYTMHFLRYEEAPSDITGSIVARVEGRTLA